MDYRIEQLRYLLREDPSSRIFYQLGELLRREGEADQAVEILRTGLERHPRYVSAWVCLGRSHRDLRTLEEARQSFQTALDLDRENPVAARLLGETAAELEDWLGAVKALKLARALTGAIDELDAQIAMVESNLDEEDRLERPFGQPRPVTPSVRCLDVVNLLVDDPFSDTTQEAEASEARGDVFRIAEDSAEVVTDEVSQDSGPPPLLDDAADETVDEIPVSDVETFDEIVPDGPLEIEDAVTAEISVSEPDGVEDEEPELVATETEIVDDPGQVSIEEASIVDQSSVGAWSMSISAAGVSGEEAWAEPSTEIVADDAVSADDPWAEPGANFDAVDAVADEPLDAADATDVVETVIDEEQPREDEQPVSDKARGDFQEAIGDDLSGDDIEITDRRFELEHGVPLPTMTLAKLALGQDDRPLAMATLESLIERDPTNTEAIAMLDELSAREETFANERLRAVQATTKIAALQGWLDAVRLAAERRVQ